MRFPPVLLIWLCAVFSCQKPNSSVSNMPELCYQVGDTDQLTIHDTLYVKNCSRSDEASLGISQQQSKANLIFQKMDENNNWKVHFPIEGRWFVFVKAKNNDCVVPAVYESFEVFVKE